MTQDTLIEYQAVIWTKDSSSPGKRVAVLATSLDDARRRLEDEYGVGTVFDLHNAEEANKPR
jgi:hypothetical protein